MTENDYVAEYVKERCPELLNTVDYSLWKLGKRLSEAAQTLVDGFKTIDWSKVQIDEKENMDDQGID